MLTCSACHYAPTGLSLCYSFVGLECARKDARNSDCGTSAVSPCCFEYTKLECRNSNEDWHSSLAFVASLHISEQIALFGSFTVTDQPEESRCKNSYAKRACF